MAPRRNVKITTPEKRIQTPPEKHIGKRQKKANPVKVPTVIKISIPCTRNSLDVPDTQRKIDVSTKIALANEVLRSQLLKEPIVERPDLTPKTRGRKKAVVSEYFNGPSTSTAGKKGKQTTPEKKSVQKTTPVVKRSLTRKRAAEPPVQKPTLKRQKLTKPVTVKLEKVTEEKVIEEKVTEKKVTKEKLPERKVLEKPQPPPPQNVSKTEKAVENTIDNQPSEENIVFSTPTKSARCRRRGLRGKEDSRPASPILQTRSTRRPQTQVSSEKSTKTPPVKNRQTRAGSPKPETLCAKSIKKEIDVSDVRDPAPVESRKTSTSSNSNLSWTRDISSSSTTTYMTVTSNDYVRFDKKLPIIKLTNIDSEVDKYKGVPTANDKSSSSNTTSSSSDSETDTSSQQPKSDDRSLSYGSPVKDNSLNLSISSHNSNVSQTNDHNFNTQTDFNKKDYSQDALNLKRALENIDEEFSTWLPDHTDVVNVNNIRDYMLQILSNEFRAISYCRNLQRLLKTMTQINENVNVEMENINDPNIETLNQSNDNNKTNSLERDKIESTPKEKSKIGKENSLDNNKNSTVETNKNNSVEYNTFVNDYTNTLNQSGAETNTTQRSKSYTTGDNVIRNKSVEHAVDENNKTKNTENFRIPINGIVYIPAAEQSEHIPTDNQTENTLPAAKKTKRHPAAVKQTEQHLPAANELEHNEPTAKQTEQKLPAAKQIEHNEPTAKLIEQNLPTDKQFEHNLPEAKETEHNLPEAEQNEYNPDKTNDIMNSPNVAGNTSEDEFVRPSTSGTIRRDRRNTYISPQFSESSDSSSDEDDFTADVDVKGFPSSPCDDDDALSLFAESITGIESSRINTSNLSRPRTPVSTEKEFEEYVPKPIQPTFISPSNYTYCPTKIAEQNKNGTVKIVCEKQNADSTSICKEKIIITRPPNLAQREEYDPNIQENFVMNTNPQANVSNTGTRGLLANLYPLGPKNVNYIFKGICYYHIIQKCKADLFNVPCRYKHHKPNDLEVKSKLVKLSDIALIREYMLIRRNMHLMRLYGLCFVNECTRRNLTRVLVEMAYDFISKGTTGLNLDEKLKVTIVEIILLYLNKVDLSECEDLLKLQYEGLLLCEWLMQIMTSTQNFSRFKPVFLSLTYFMVNNDRTFKLHVAEQILERVCILSFDESLVKALLQIMRLTDPAIFLNKSIVHLEKMISVNKDILQEYMLLKRDMHFGTLSRELLSPGVPQMVESVPNVSEQPMLPPVEMLMDPSVPPPLLVLPVDKPLNIVPTVGEGVPLPPSPDTTHLDQMNKPGEETVVPKITRTIWTTPNSQVAKSSPHSSNNENAGHSNWQNRSIFHQLRRGGFTSPRHHFMRPPIRHRPPGRMMKKPHFNDRLVTYGGSPIMYPPPRPDY